MTEDTVLLERGTVARVTINRPAVRNALNTATIELLIERLSELHDDASVRVVVLTGAGEKAFSAGADLAEVEAARDALSRRRYFGGVAHLIERIATLRKPVIARVQGYALAGGCGLAAACDFAIAADDAVFGLPEVKLGLYPMVVMAPILRAVGRKAAVDLFFTGRTVSGREAAAMGLITRSVPRDQLDEAVDVVAKQLLAASPQALEMGKAALLDADAQHFLQQLHYLREMVALTAGSDDAAEGIRAFFEKRPPRWQV